MKSDHPVLDSRYLLFEAQQAHSNGLAAHLALASVTSAPATVAGMNHRVGFVRKNYDADLVLWDSHPLALGATPLQVFIDGIPQLRKPFSAKPLSTNLDPPSIASRPVSPLTLRDDDDILNPAPATIVVPEVIFTNVGEVLIKGQEAQLAVAAVAQLAKESLLQVLIKDGQISYASHFESNATKVDLKGAQ